MKKFVAILLLLSGCQTYSLHEITQAYWMNDYYFIRVENIDSWKVRNLQCDSLGLAPGDRIKVSGQDTIVVYSDFRIKTYRHAVD